MNQTKTDRKQHSQLLLASANADVAELNCSAETTASLIASVLKQHTTLVNAPRAPLLSPVADRRLVLLLSDLHPPRPDKYATVEAVAFAPPIALTSSGQPLSVSSWSSQLPWTVHPQNPLIEPAVSREHLHSSWEHPLLLYPLHPHISMWLLFDIHQLRRCTLHTSTCCAL